MTKTTRASLLTDVAAARFEHARACASWTRAVGLEDRAAAADGSEWAVRADARWDAALAALAKFDVEAAS